VKAFVGWLLATISLLLGLLVFLFVIDLLPPGPLASFIGGLLSFGGWLFGTAAPAMGDAAIDRFRDGSNGAPPTTTTAP
jgi:hypothetical protein